MRRSTTIWALVALVNATARPQTDNGLVAWYRFDEGTGTVARDNSGHENHGEVHGAKFVRVGTGYALQFDGVDDYVDCGARSAFDVREAFTIEFWMLQTVGVPPGQPWVLGKCGGTFWLTMTMGRLYAYVGSGGSVNSVFAVPTPGSWHHITLTFQSKTLSIYLDGRLVWARVVKSERLGARPSVPFWVGRVSGAEGAFEGTLDEVRFYNRARTTEEVLTQYRTSGWSLGPAVRAVFAPSGERLVAQADLRNVKERPDGASVEIEISAGGKAIARRRIGKLDRKEFVETSLDTTTWQAGDYSVSASVTDAEGRRIAPVTTCTARRQDADFEATERGYRRRNNLVVEILSLSFILFLQ